MNRGRTQLNPFDKFHDSSPTDFAFALGHHILITLKTGFNKIDMFGSIIIGVVNSRVYGLNLDGKNIRITRQEEEFVITRPFIILEIGDT